jgi:glycolate oxidase FAD binding subunit
VGSWLCGFREPDSAAGALGDLADSTLQPERVVVVAGRIPAALGLPDAAAGLLVAFGSVPPAVRSQGEALTRLARARGATVSPVDEAAWARLDALVEGPVVLRLAGEPARLVHWAVEIERHASRVGLAAFVAAEAGSGVIRAALAGAASPEVCRDQVLAPLREALAPEGGSVVVERSAADLKAVVDVWGPVPPEALALMRRLKAEFDPAGTLNPGRYVGGL